jgi:hypothetical protein
VWIRCRGFHVDGSCRCLGVNVVYKEDGIILESYRSMYRYLFIAWPLASLRGYLIFVTHCVYYATAVSYILSA